MEGAKNDADSLMKGPQLVQYEDDEDNDDKFESSHSGHQASGRDTGGEDGGRQNDGRGQINAELETQGVEVMGGTQILGEDGRDYQVEMDGVVREFQVETSFRREMVVEETQIIEEGGDLAADAMEVFREYETLQHVTHVVHPQEMSTLSPPVGSGTDYSQDELHERGAEEAALEEAVLEDGVHAEHSNVYLPEESGRGEDHSSFSSMQQLQLRAQILVYGDLIKGLLPEESLMSSAFTDTEEEPGPESIGGIGGWNWESTWQIAADKDAEKKEAERLLGADNNNLKLDVMTEGDVVNAGAKTLEPGTPSTSPSRTAEDPLREQGLPGTGPGASGNVEISMADLDQQHADMNGIPSSLTVNLDAVVDNIVASSVNAVDIAGLKEPRIIATRSPSLDPWLKPTASQVPPITGPIPMVDSSLHPPAWPNNPTWVTPPDVADPVSGSQVAATLNMTPANIQANDGVTGTDSPAGVQMDGDSEDGSRKRKGRGRERKTPVAKTAAAKTPAAKPRKSRAKKTPTVEIASPAGVLDSNSRPAGVPSRLIYESSTATVVLAGGPPASPPAGKKHESQERTNLHANTQIWVEQAKASFEEAASAASAAEQVNVVKSQSTPLDQGSGNDYQFNSAVAAVSAAAAVARAAADAARVAYEAAKAAALMVSDGFEKSNSSTGNGQGDKDGGSLGRRSAIAAAKEEARKRASATTPSKVHPQSTDAVLKAARLMADAANQASVVLAKGNSNVTGVPQSPVPQDDAKRLARGRPRKEDVGITSPEHVNTTEQSPKEVKETRGSMKKGARKRGKDALASKSPLKKGDDGQSKPSPGNPGKATRRQLDQLTSPSNVADAPEITQQADIADGSLIEVMNDEEGLRGGWFAAKVIQMRPGEACAQYEEILTDDGTTQLKEWFPIEGPANGDSGEPGRPRIRLMSPNNIAREEGRQKRRKTTLGQKVWSVGDCVDAFVQDGWWEGIVKAVDEDDENKVTVYFPGEGDTSTVKAHNLRPSFLWKAGRWEQWTRDGQQPIKLADIPAPKKQKTGESPKMQAQKGQKSSPPVVKGSDEATGTSRASRSRKTSDTEGSSPLSPTITTRSSPRQKMPPKRKDDPIKLASPDTEEAIPTQVTPAQVSTPVSTRARPVAEDAVTPVVQPKTRSAVAAGLASLTESSMNPVVQEIGRKSKGKVTSPSKLNKSPKQSVQIASPLTTARITRQKAKA